MWYRKLESHFVAVYSSQLDAVARARVLASARRQWPFVRTRRDESRWPEHAMFSSRDFDHSRRLSQDERQAAEDEARRLEREVIEWSRQFGDITFAVLELEDRMDWMSGGYVCRNGVVLRRLEFERNAAARDLIVATGLPPDFELFGGRQFCELADVFTEWLAALSVVEDYRVEMERSLQREWGEHEESAKGHFHPDWADEVEDPVDYLEGYHREMAEKENWYQVTLTQELRRNVLVSAYSHLEQALYSVCCQLHQHRDGYPALGNVAEPGQAGIFKSKPFLEKLDPRVFAGSSAWPAIKRYNRIRNWIVHRGRELKATSQEERAELARLNEVLVGHDDIKSDGGLLTLEPQMSATAVEQMQTFLGDVQAALKIAARRS